MTMLATDPAISQQTAIASDGSKSVVGLTNRGWAAAKVASGLLRDNDNHSALSPAQIASLALARADAAIDLLDIVPTAAYREGDFTVEQRLTFDMLSGYQGDDLDLTAILAVPATPTVGLAGLGAGNVEHITVPIAPTGALAAVPIAGNVNLITVPTAPTAAAAGAGAGNVDSVTVPIAPTMVEGAAGLVDVGSHWYVVTYTSADGETTMGAISAEIAIAAAAKHVTVTIPVSAQAGVTGRKIYRSKIGGAHVARTDFFLVGTVADNSTVTFDDNMAEAGMPATNPPAANNAAQYKYLVTYVAGDGTETSMGAIQAAAVVMADKSADGKITVTIPTSAEAGVVSRKIYRSKLGQARAARTDFFYAGTVADNTTGTFTDNVAESGLTTNPPSSNGTGGHKYIVTYVTNDGETLMGAISAAITVANPAVNGQVELVIPVSSQAKVTQRKIYRSQAGVAATLRTHFLLLATIANNTATTYTDNTADSGLGAAAPAANTAAGYKYKITFVSPSGESLPSVATAKITVADKSANGKVALTVIPTGPVGTTARNIYRTKAGDSGGTLYYLGQIADNTTVVYTDNTADSGLTTTVSPPSSDSATAGMIAQRANDIANAVMTLRGSTGTYAVGAAPANKTISSTGAVVYRAMNVGEMMDSMIGDGWCSDSVNIGAHSDAQLAAHFKAVTDAIIAALNA